MSKRIYAVSGTREIFPEDRRFIAMALMSEGVNVCEEGYDQLHHGNAEGVDKLIARLAENWGWDVIPYDADWERLGKGAGPIRNRTMLDVARPEILYAFPAKASTRRQRSKGTLDCIEAALERDIDVKVWWLT